MKYFRKYHDEIEVEEISREEALNRLTGYYKNADAAVKEEDAC